MEIRSLHFRQRPLSASQDTRGTLSRGSTAVPQCGHCERGVTRDSPRGSRLTTTLRKLPATAPARLAIATTPPMSAPPRGGLRLAAEGYPFSWRQEFWTTPAEPYEVIVLKDFA